MGIGSMIFLELESRGKLIRGDGTVVVYTEEEKSDMRESLSSESLRQRKKAEEIISRLSLPQIAN